MKTYTCLVCGWVGQVKGRARCLPCYAKAVNRWRKDNPDKAKAQKARWMARMKKERHEHYLTRRRKYYLPATGKRNYERRKAWLLAGDVTRAQLQAIYTLWRGLCAYCGKPVKARLCPSWPTGFDHVTPKRQGGKHTATNMVVCCQQCNELKG